MKHINHALVAKTHPPMYYMHKYWARKPHNIVREYIETYTEKDDIVLDPFCGSGVTCIESLKSGRNTIGIDLDPMAIFITKMTAYPINIKNFLDEYNKIEDNIKNKILTYYTTKCIKCDKKAIISHVIWRRDKNNIHVTEPIEIWYDCPCNKKRLNKKLDDSDKNLLGKLNKYITLEQSKRLYLSRIKDK